jgi:WD40 repeat protein
VRESERSLRVYDAATGKALGPPLFHSSAVLDAEFSRDGDRLVTASDDNSARIWEIASGKLLAQPLRHNGSIWCAAFSPDGRLVATAGADQVARVWDARTGEPISPPLGYSGKAGRVSFRADGKRVSVAGRDSVRTWELRHDDRPLDDLLSLTQLLAGSQVDPDRGFLPLSNDRLQSLWRKRNRR